MRNQDYRLFVLDNDEYERICRLITLLSDAVSDLIIGAQVPPAGDPIWGAADDLRMESLNLKDKRNRREKGLTN